MDLFSTYASLELKTGNLEKAQENATNAVQVFDKYKLTDVAKLVDALVPAIIWWYRRLYLVLKELNRPEANKVLEFAYERCMAHLDAFLTTDEERKNWLTEYGAIAELVEIWEAQASS